MTESTTQTIICGDFNCWVDDLEDRKGIKFRQLIDEYNLRIFNSGPTSRGGHTLDLVMADDSGNFLLEFESDDYFQSIHFPRLSDHQPRTRWFHFGIKATSQLRTSLTIFASCLMLCLTLNVTVKKIRN